MFFHGFIGCYSFAYFNVNLEEPSLKGRSDLVYTWKDEAFILELKMGTKKNVNKKVIEGFQQVVEKKYAAKHILSNKTLVRVGVLVISDGGDVLDRREYDLNKVKESIEEENGLTELLFPELVQW